MPQTTEYLLLGLVVVAIIMGALVISMVARTRSAERELQSLDE